MSTAGPVSAQGCAIRMSRLAADGSVVASVSGMVQDDRKLVKLTLTPNVQAGVEMNPLSACGAPIIAVKDFDRIKRYDVALDLGDADFEGAELAGGGTLITAATSAGRTLADGATTINDTTLTSAGASFTINDVGRTATATGIPAGAYIVRFISATQVVLSAAATATATGLSVVLGAIASRTIGLQAVKLLDVANPNGIGIEVWSKAFVRGTGFQGTTPYPHSGSSIAPVLNPSAYIRTGAFRCIMRNGPIGIEDKEAMSSYVGWAVENPFFGTGPVHDWTTTALVGGPPVDTTRVWNQMMDFQLPTPLQPGYQTTT